ncbi:MAG: purine-cytosine permease family protein [Streptosporangiaceae bacterium]
MPASRSSRSCFWWTYAGSAIGTVWMMAFGPFAAIIVLGVIAVNVLNLYGAFMSFTTTATAIRPFSVHRGTRLVVVLATAVIGTALAVAGRGDFITAYENFILFLTYFLVPWTAVNLVDFYLVRKERYDIEAIFTPHGRYGAVSGRALAAYLAGIAIEIPFMSTSFYTGPVVGILGGADISWILGLIVSSAVYYLLMRREVEETRPGARATGRHRGRRLTRPGHGRDPGEAARPRAAMAGYEHTVAVEGREPMSFALVATVAAVLAAVVLVSCAVVILRARGGSRAVGTLTRVLTGTSGRAVNILATLVGLAAALAALVLVARIAFTVFEVNPHNQLVESIRHLAHGLAWDFRDLFLPHGHKVRVGVNFGIAAAVYLVVGRVVAGALRRLAP